MYEDAPEPELGAGDALIRVHATGITPAELTWAETYRNCDGSDRLPATPWRRPDRHLNAGWPAIPEGSWCWRSRSHERGRGMRS